MSFATSEGLLLVHTGIRDFPRLLSHEIIYEQLTCDRLSYFYERLYYLYYRILYFHIYIVCIILFRGANIVQLYIATKNSSFFFIP